MDGLNMELLKSLQCPSCHQSMKNEIFVCYSGHSLCQSCWKSTKTCSICKFSMTDTRNYSLENVTKLLQYPCENEARGCQNVLSMEELATHQQLCDYRNYNCVVDECCSWKGTRSQLKKHFLDKHDTNVLLGNECICLWKHDKPEYTVYVMFAFEELFYVHNKIVNDIMYWAVQYIGRSEDIILFCFEIQIFTDQFTDRRLEFSEICHDDVKDDVDEILDTGFCVAVPMHVLETYINAEGTIFYKIQIKRA